MSHFGALAAATSRYAALYPNSAHGDPKSLPWYWGRMPPTHPSQLDRPSPNGKYQNYIVFKHIKSHLKASQLAKLIFLIPDMQSSLQNVKVINIIEILCF